MNHQVYYWDLLRFPKFDLNPGAQAQASIARSNSMLSKKNRSDPVAAGKRLWNPCWEGHPRINLNLSYLIIHFGGFNLGFPSTWIFGMIKKQPFTKYDLLPKIRFFTQKMIFWIQGCIIFWVPKFRGVYQVQGIYIYIYIPAPSLGLYFQPVWDFQPERDSGRKSACGLNS